MVLFFFLSIELFFATLQSRLIFGGDSAEYSTIARIWGIAHPPGYPFYSFLINVINRIVPFGTTPWRVAFLSSIPTVLTAYFIYKILLLLKITSVVSFLTSVLYLFLFPIWMYALVPEVFGLHTMLVAMITYLLLLYLKSPQKKYVLTASFLCGLCVSHHHIFILFIPGWLFLLKDKLKKIYLDKKTVVSIVFLGLLGASFYLYAIIVSLNHTILDWTNAKTVGGLFQLITRSSYGSFKAYAGSGANISNQISDVISSFVFIFLDFKLLGIVFIIAGIYAANKKMRRFFSFLIISVIAHLFFLFYTNFILSSSFSSGMYERFLIPLYFILIFFLGIGVDYLYKILSVLILQLIQNISLKKVTTALFFIFFCLFIFLIAFQNYKTISLVSLTKTFDQFGKDILATVPRGGVLSTQGDNSTFAIYYHLYALKERNDLAFTIVGLMGNQHYIELLKKRTPNLITKGIISNADDFKEFVSLNEKAGYYTDAEPGFGAWRPYGLLWKYYPDTLAASSDSASLLKENKRLWEKVYKIPLMSSAEKNIFHAKTVWEQYMNAYRNYSRLLVFFDKYSEAEKVLKNIAEIYKKDDLQSTAMYMNILVYEKKCDEATTVADKINLDKIIKKYPTFVKSALPYLTTCRPNDVRIPAYTLIQKSLDKNAKTSLESF